jgi:hypothetical protein
MALTAASMTRWQFHYESDFIARRFGLTLSLARIVAALANLKSAFG